MDCALIFFFNKDSCKYTLKLRIYVFTFLKELYRLCLRKRKSGID